MKSISNLLNRNPFQLSNELNKEIRKLGLEVINRKPYCDEADELVEFGGKYKGIHLSIGLDYYTVNRELSDHSYFVEDGAGFLQKELDYVLNV